MQGNIDPSLWWEESHGLKPFLKIPLSVTLLTSKLPEAMTSFQYFFYVTSLWASFHSMLSFPLAHGTLLSLYLFQPLICFSIC